MISRETENVQSSSEVEQAFRALTSGEKPYITAQELYAVSTPVHGYCFWVGLGVWSCWLLWFVKVQADCCQHGVVACSCVLLLFLWEKGIIVEGRFSWEKCIIVKARLQPTHFNTLLKTPQRKQWYCGWWVHHASLSQSVQSAAGLEAVKPVARSCSLVCVLLPCCLHRVSWVCRFLCRSTGLGVLKVPVDCLRLKPVLNWVKCLFAEHTSDSLTNYDLFLIELLICWTWFGQFEELYFILNWLIMRRKLQPKLAADSMIQNVG